MNEIICYCKNISKSDIKEAIAKGAKNLKDIQEMTDACTGNRCKELNPKSKCCSEDILKMFDKQKPRNNSNCCCCK
jgi:bacterioferritin-associated ferredoxin